MLGQRKRLIVDGEAVLWLCVGELQISESVRGEGKRREETEGNIAGNYGKNIKTPQTAARRLVLKIRCGAE